MIATHFIEVVKHIDGSITNVGPTPIRLLEWALGMNERGFSGKTVAVFKVYPKSCNLSCSPSDWKNGGKCDLNGCYTKNK